MSDVLAGIAAYKRIDVAARKAATSQDAVEALARQASAPRGFRAALDRRATPGRPALIAEIKKASPSKGLIRPDFDPPAIMNYRTDATCGTRHFDRRPLIVQRLTGLPSRSRTVTRQVRLPVRSSVM